MRAFLTAPSTASPSLLSLRHFSGIVYVEHSRSDADGNPLCWTGMKGRRWRLCVNPLTHRSMAHSRKWYMRILVSINKGRNLHANDRADASHRQLRCKYFQPKASIPEQRVNRLHRLATPSIACTASPHLALTSLMSTTTSPHQAPASPISAAQHQRLLQLPDPWQHRRKTPRTQPL
jgi:hypothetical protein